MATWNVRIIYHNKEEHPWYGVHEVFYNEDKSIYAYTENPIDITGETPEEVKNYVKLILNDIDKTAILIESEIVLVYNADEEELMDLEAFLEDEENRPID